jgi:predicted DNA-binding protein
MPRDKSEAIYVERFELRVTKHMLADLQNVSEKSRQPIAAIVRQAIRNYLDDTDLTLGTRRTFDRRFQRRMEALERMMERYLLTTLILSASQFANPSRGAKGGDLIRESARLAVGDAGSQVRQMVLKNPGTENEG